LTGQKITTAEKIKPTKGTRTMKTKCNLIELCLLAATWLLTVTAPAQPVLTVLANFNINNSANPQGGLTLGKL
jgi:hypothetical protein